METTFWSAVTTANVSGDSMVAASSLALAHALAGPITERALARCEFGACAAVTRAVRDAARSCIHRFCGGAPDEPLDKESLDALIDIAMRSCRPDILAKGSLTDRWSEDSEDPERVLPDVQPRMWAV